MTYQVLARKWRPKKFADLVGQEHVVKALLNALNKGRLHHAYLLTGTRGVGKTTIARILAKSLNCPHTEHGEPCNHCNTCQQIDAGRFVDVLEIDAASNTGIDNIREVLENAQYAPTMGSYKVYIIDEVHMLSKSAFNAMLKTLEEPPEHIKFILATTDPQKVPVTVLSRCLQFVLRNLNTTQVYDHLVYVLQQEQLAYEDTALQLLGRAAAGSMRDALSLLDQAIAIGSGQVTEADVRNMIGAVDKSYLYGLLEALSVRNGQALLAKVTEMTTNAIGFDSALTELALLLQQLSLLQTIPSAIQTDDPEYAALTHLASLFSPEQIQLYYQCALRGKADLPLAPDENAGFMMTLLRMLAFAPLATLSEQRLHGQIGGTELQNAPKTATVTAKSDTAQAANAEMASSHGERVSELNPEAVSIAKSPVANNSLLEPDFTSISTTESNPAKPVATEVQNELIPAVITAESIAETVPVETHVPGSQADAAIKATASDEIKPAVESSPSSLVNEITPAVHTSETAIVAESEGTPVSLPTANDSAIAEPALLEEAFPPLNAENWPAILARLAHKLGAVQLFSQHSAIVDYDEKSSNLTIALAEQGEPTANRELLTRLADSLSAVYGTSIHIHTCGWTEESRLETPKMRQDRLLKQAQQQAQSSLEAEPVVQNLLKTFDASWVSESLQLRE